MSVHKALPIIQLLSYTVGEIFDLIEQPDADNKRILRLKMLMLKEQVEQLDKRADRFEKKADMLEKEKDHWKRLAEQLKETIIKESER